LLIGGGRTGQRGSRKIRRILLTGRGGKSANQQRKRARAGGNRRGWAEDLNKIRKTKKANRQNGGCIRRADPQLRQGGRGQIRKNAHDKMLSGQSVGRGANTGAYRVKGKRKAEAGREGRAP